MRTLALLALLTLPACDWIGDTADSIGSHMPVIGERCEHWQCFTQSGKAQSEAARQRPKGQPQQDTPPPLPPREEEQEEE
jgi:hypothetical protein